MTKKKRAYLMLASSSLNKPIAEKVDYWINENKGTNYRVKLNGKEWDIYSFNKLYEINEENKLILERVKEVINNKKLKIDEKKKQIKLILDGVLPINWKENTLNSI